MASGCPSHRHLTVLLLVLLPLVTAGGRAVRYDGHRVYRVTPQTEAQQSKIKEYLHDTPAADVWQQGAGLQEPVDIRVPPNHVTTFGAHFRSHGIPHETFIHDVQEKIERSKRSTLVTSPGDFERYHTCEEINKWLEDRVVSDICQGLCTLHQIGKSTEGRDLKVIQIGYPGHKKERLWIDAGIHAREWIAPATAMYIIDKLTSAQGENSLVEHLLRMYDWYILPLVNPDGYSYTMDEQGDRLWRKTRSQDSETGCYGVDANRNFDFKWMSNIYDLRSFVPCSNTYAGHTPFSEPEAVAVRNALLSLQGYAPLETTPRSGLSGNAPGGPVHLYMTLHSYSQLWMAPWGWTKHLPGNIVELMDLGQVAVDAVYSVHNTTYKLGPASSILYKSSGTSRDWAYGNGIPYVYTVELRDHGQFGFLLPADQIKPCAHEVWTGILAMVSDPRFSSRT